MIPYIQGLSEQLSRTCQSHGVYLSISPATQSAQCLYTLRTKNPKEINTQIICFGTTKVFALIKHEKYNISRGCENDIFGQNVSF